MRHINERGIEIVKSFEGFSLTSYLCPGDVWTVGYGATRSSDGGPVRMDMEPISEADADALLSRDLEATEGWVHRLIKTLLTEIQFSALVSFTFNVGAGALQRSTLRIKLNRGEYQNAADEFLRWVFCNGKRLRGWCYGGRMSGPCF